MLEHHAAEEMKTLKHKNKNKIKTTTNRPGRESSRHGSFECAYTTSWWRPAAGGLSPPTELTHSSAPLWVQFDGSTDAPNSKYKNVLLNPGDQFQWCVWGRGFTEAGVSTLLRQLFVVMHTTVSPSLTFCTRRNHRSANNKAQYSNSGCCAVGFQECQVTSVGAVVLSSSLGRGGSLCLSLSLSLSFR